MTGSCILHACEINKNGSGNVLEGAEISKKIKSEELAWVHLDAANEGTRDWLRKEVSYLDDLILNALLAEETRPRILEFENGVLLILRGMNLNENAEPEDMLSVRLWVGPDRIISLQRRNVKAIQDIRERLMAGNGPKNAADFLVMLSARLFERMEPTLTELNERTDDVEEKVMESPDISERQEIVDIRRKAIVFRRHITPQRDVIAHLRTCEQGWIDTQHRRQLQESYDRLVRYVEDLDTVRERAQIVKDELTNALSDRLNKNMYVLSVIAAIFLPLGFLTGLLGINIGGIPGADNQDAFFIFCAMLVALVSGQVWLFKKLKWF